MRLDKDYLLELELWSHFEMRGLGHDHAPAQSHEARASSTAPPAQPPALMSNERGRVAAVARVNAPAPAVVQKGVKVAPSATRAPGVPVAPGSPGISGTAPDPARLAAISGADWVQLAELTANCTSCRLCKQRKQTVLGVGANTAHWLFVGDGPGDEEDQVGEPFVGPTGKLLDALLSAAGLARGREVYIANVVKCRPPGDRTPLPEEAAACAPILDRQIDLIRPKIIVALGKTAIMRLIGVDTAMAALRGKVYRYRDVPVIVTYHPAYLLRNLPEKLKAWEDLQLAKSTLAQVL